MRYLLTLKILILVLFNLKAQTPQRMTYQAVIRDANEKLIKNQQVGLRMSILKGSVFGAAEYVEQHTASTNASGLISIQIGGGKPILGSMEKLRWSDDQYFIKMEIDPNGGNNYQLSSTNQLLAVPYAMHAATADSALENDPVFKSSLAYTINPSDTAYWNSKLDSMRESDPLYKSSVAYSITTTDTANWNNKIERELDPLFTNSLAAALQPSDTVFWNAKLDTFIEHDPSFQNALAAGITAADTSSWNRKLENEQDPFFSNSVGASISASDTLKWNAKIDAEMDSSVTNELQTLQLSGDTLSLSKSNKVVIPPRFNGDYNSLSNVPVTLSSFQNDVGYLTQEGDADSLNEIQSLRISGDTLFLENGGFARLPGGNSKGDMRYWNGQKWVYIPIGSPGQVLQISPNGNPEWRGAGYASLTTDSVKSINPTTAYFEADISANNGSKVTERGFCWATSSSPTLSDSSTSVGKGTGKFSAQINKLNGGQTYYVRAYATNGAGTVYGNELVLLMQSAYSIGSTGPAGGIVFYDKGSYSNGWRYLESSTTDQSLNEDWGCQNVNITGANGSGYGAGQQNTFDILSSCSGTIAASVADGYATNGYTDWYLPSRNELDLMYVNMKQKGRGNFSIDTYWSSTEASSLSAYGFNFNNPIVNNKSTNYRVRAIRRF